MSILVKRTEYLRIEDICDLKVQFVRLRMTRNRKQTNKSGVLRIEECAISNVCIWAVL